MSTVGTADAGDLSQEEKGGHTLGDSTAASSVAPQTSSQMPQGGEFEVCAPLAAPAAHAAHAASAAHAAHAAHAAPAAPAAPLAAHAARAARRIRRPRHIHISLSPRPPAPLL